MSKRLGLHCSENRSLKENGYQKLGMSICGTFKQEDMNEVIRLISIPLPQFPTLFLSDCKAITA